MSVIYTLIKVYFLHLLIIKIEDSINKIFQRVIYIIFIYCLYALLFLLGVAVKSPEPAGIVQLIGRRRNGSKPTHLLAALGLPVRTCNEQPH